ncbi:hypothetical protein SQ11_01220 [Nitrosospira sp. NpAV]|nr:hypothetical protein SQ11_01220 [Nitrosospira sp. NpAV]
MNELWQLWRQAKLRFLPTIAPEPASGPNWSAMRETNLLRDSLAPIRKHAIGCAPFFVTLTVFAALRSCIIKAS